MRYCLTLAALALTLGPGIASANLITNGDFESGPVGWTLNGHAYVAAPQGNPLWFGGGTAAQNGQRIAVFNGGNTTPNGTVSQTFATVAGETYIGQFDYGVTGQHATDTQQINFDVLGSSNANLFNLLVTGVNPPAALQTFNFSFVANGSSATLWFTDIANNHTRSTDGILDNVSVQAQPVPEPATLGLLGLGLLATALAGTRGRKR